MYRAITRITSRFTAVITGDDVREIYAMLCLQLLANGKAKLRSFDPSRGNSLASWLGLLACHAAYDFLRSRKREPRSEVLSEVEPLAGALPSPFDLCEVRQRARMVADILATFTERDQRFIELYFGEGFEPERIARIMGISVKTVYSKKHKIQAKLEDLMGQRTAAA
jgi:RNA polymerase sigma-70 factor (ECF subfamily)